MLSLLLYFTKLLLDTLIWGIIPGYYKRNRHFQCCIETKLLMI